MKHLNLENASSEAVYERERRKLELSKLHSENEKLRLETEKLNAEVVDARRPYLFRNSQLLTAAIATLGALIGVYVSAKTHYFDTLSAQAQLAREQAELSKAEAIRVKREADVLKASAEGETLEAARISAYAKVTTDKAKAEVLKFEASAREAKILAAQEAIATEHEKFERSSIPEFIYEDRLQLSALSLQYQATDSAGWLGDTHIRELNFSLMGLQPSQAANAIKTFPSSVITLAFDSPSAMIDLSAVPSIGKVRALSIGADRTGDTVEIRGLSQATNLESLAVRGVNNNLKGLDAVGSLVHLREFSVTTHEPPMLSRPELEKLTSVSIIGRQNDKPISWDGMDILASAPKLTAIHIVGTIDNQFSGKLLNQFQGIQVLDLGYNRPPATNLSFPSLKSLGCNLTPEDLSSHKLEEFPNLTSLELFLSGSWKAEDFRKLFAALASAHPKLRALSILGDFYMGDAEEVALPPMPELASLELSIPAWKEQKRLHLTVSPEAEPALRVLRIGGENLRPGDLAKLSDLKYLFISDADGYTIDELETRHEHLQGFGISLKETDIAGLTLGKRFAKLLGTFQPISLVLDASTQRWVKHLPPSTRRLSVVFIPKYDRLLPLNAIQGSRDIAIPSMFMP